MADGYLLTVLEYKGMIRKVPGYLVLVQETRFRGTTSVHAPGLVHTHWFTLYLCGFRRAYFHIYGGVPLICSATDQPIENAHEKRREESENTVPVVSEKHKAIVVQYQ